MTNFSPTAKILIYGFAREGVSSLNFLRRRGLSQKIFIADDKNLDVFSETSQAAFTSDKNLEFILGSDLLTSPNRNFTHIFLTPGIPLKRLPKGLWPIVTSQTSIFLEKFSAQTVGVTGTKGKGTTSSLIYNILTTAGKKAVLLGNIGTPALDLFDAITKDTTVVYELSSHQLTLATKSPHIAVITNIFPEHLDYYGDFDSYLHTKAKITQFQTSSDHLVINLAFPELKKIADATHAQVYPIVSPNPVWKTKLLGDFNQHNIATAWEVCKLLGVLQSLAKTAVENFTPLEHRLEPVGTFKNITFYNDSFATVPESTSQAMNTFGDHLETLITGGFDRGIEYTQLSQAIDASKIKTLIVFPTTGQKIIAGLTSKTKPTIFEVTTMEEAVRLAYQHTQSGKVVLMSCASPSFNLFTDFKDRGDQFKTWVVKLGKNP